MTFNVTDNVPFNRSHTISYISQLPLSCTIFDILSQLSLNCPNLKSSHDPQHIPLGVIYHTFASTLYYQSEYQI